MATDNETSCVNDPNFAVICSFLEKFSESCGITHPNILELQEMLDNTHEVPQALIDLHVKLLRKARKSVSGERWEKAITKFCHSYSNQDGWEIERFGYKKARISVKLRILKTLLEVQFDLNPKFKTEVNRLSADELRCQPLGRDKMGQTYWCQLDEDCNLRVYREDLDDETWEIVARDREGLLQLISQLSSNDPFKNDSEALLNEDSNSLETEKPIIDTGQMNEIQREAALSSNDEEFQEIDDDDDDDFENEGKERNILNIKNDEKNEESGKNCETEAGRIFEYEKKDLLVIHEKEAKKVDLHSVAEEGSQISLENEKLGSVGGSTVAEKGKPNITANEDQGDVIKETKCAIKEEQPIGNQEVKSEVVVETTEKSQNYEDVQVEKSIADSTTSNPESKEKEFVVLREGKDGQDLNESNHNIKNEYSLSLKNKEGQSIKEEHEQSIKIRSFKKDESDQKHKEEKNEILTEDPAESVTGEKGQNVSKEIEQSIKACPPKLKEGVDQSSKENMCNIEDSSQNKGNKSDQSNKEHGDLCNKEEDDQSIKEGGCNASIEKEGFKNIKEEKGKSEQKESVNEGGTEIINQQSKTSGNERSKLPKEENVNGNKDNNKNVKREKTAMFAVGSGNQDDVLKVDNERNIKVESAYSSQHPAHLDTTSISNSPSKELPNTGLLYSKNDLTEAKKSMRIISENKRSDVPDNNYIGMDLSRASRHPFTQTPIVTDVGIDLSSKTYKETQHPLHSIEKMSERSMPIPVSAVEDLTDLSKRSQLISESYEQKRYSSLSLTATDLSKKRLGSNDLLLKSKVPTVNIAPEFSSLPMKCINLSGKRLHESDIKVNEAKKLRLEQTVAANCHKMISAINSSGLPPHYSSGNFVCEDSDEVGEAIEEPLMLVRGEGSGADCNTGNPGKDGDEGDKKCDTSTNNQSSNENTMKVESCTVLKERDSVVTTKETEEDFQETSTSLEHNNFLGVNEACSNLEGNKGIIKVSEVSKKVDIKSTCLQESVSSKEKNIDPTFKKTKEDMGNSTSIENIEGNMLPSHSGKSEKSGPKHREISEFPLSEVTTDDKELKSESTMQSTPKQTPKLWSIETICAPDGKAKDFRKTGSSSTKGAGPSLVGIVSDSMYGEKYSSKLNDADTSGKINSGTAITLKRPSRWDVGGGTKTEKKEEEEISSNESVVVDQSSSGGSLEQKGEKENVQSPISALNDLALINKDSVLFPASVAAAATCQTNSMVQIAEAETSTGREECTQDMQNNTLEGISQKPLSSERKESGGTKSSPKELTTQGFFFGPGCLLKSPIKKTVETASSNEKNIETTFKEISLPTKDKSNVVEKLIGNNPIKELIQEENSDQDINTLKLPQDFSGKSSEEMEISCENAALQSKEEEKKEQLIANVKEDKRDTKICDKLLFTAEKKEMLLDPVEALKKTVHPNVSNINVIDDNLDKNIKLSLPTGEDNILQPNNRIKTGESNLGSCSISSARKVDDLLSNYNSLNKKPCGVKTDVEIQMSKETPSCSEEKTPILESSVSDFSEHSSEILKINSNLNEEKNLESATILPKTIISECSSDLKDGKQTSSESALEKTCEQFKIHGKESSLSGSDDKKTLEMLNKDIKKPEIIKKSVEQSKISSKDHVEEKDVSSIKSTNEEFCSSNITEKSGKMITNVTVKNTEVYDSSHSNSSTLSSKSVHVNVDKNSTKSNLLEKTKSDFPILSQSNSKPAENKSETKCNVLDSKTREELSKIGKESFASTLITKESTTGSTVPKDTCIDEPDTSDIKNSSKGYLGSVEKISLGKTEKERHTAIDSKQNVKLIHNDYNTDSKNKITLNESGNTSVTESKIKMELKSVKSASTISISSDDYNEDTLNTKISADVNIKNSYGTSKHELKQTKKDAEEGLNSDICTGKIEVSPPNKKSGSNDNVSAYKISEGTPGSATKCKGTFKSEVLKNYSIQKGVCAESLEMPCKSDDNTKCSEDSVKQAQSSEIHESLNDFKKTTSLPENSQHTCSSNASGNEDVLCKPTESTGGVKIACDAGKEINVKNTFNKLEESSDKVHDKERFLATECSNENNTTGKAIEGKIIGETLLSSHTSSARESSNSDSKQSDDNTVEKIAKVINQEKHQLEFSERVKNMESISCHISTKDAELTKCFSADKETEKVDPGYIKDLAKNEEVICVEKGSKTTKNLLNLKSSFEKEKLELAPKTKVEVHHKGRRKSVESISMGIMMGKVGAKICLKESQDNVSVSESKVVPEPSKDTNSFSECTVGSFSTTASQGSEKLSDNKNTNSSDLIGSTKDANSDNIISSVIDPINIFESDKKKKNVGGEKSAENISSTRQEKSDPCKQSTPITIHLDNAILRKSSGSPMLKENKLKNDECPEESHVASADVIVNYSDFPNETRAPREMQNSEKNLIVLDSHTLGKELSKDSELSKKNLIVVDSEKAGSEDKDMSKECELSVSKQGLSDKAKGKEEQKTSFLREDKKLDSEDAQDPSKFLDEARNNVKQSNLQSPKELQEEQNSAVVKERAKIKNDIKSPFKSKSSDKELLLSKSTVVQPEKFKDCKETFKLVSSNESDNRKEKADHEKQKESETKCTENVIFKQSDKSDSSEESKITIKNLTDEEKDKEAINEKGKEICMKDKNTSQPEDIPCTIKIKKDDDNDADCIANRSFDENKLEHFSTNQGLQIKKGTDDTKLNPSIVSVHLEKTRSSSSDGEEREDLGGSTDGESETGFLQKPVERSSRGGRKSGRGRRGRGGSIRGRSRLQRSITGSNVDTGSSKSEEMKKEEDSLTPPLKPKSNKGKRTPKLMGLDLGVDIVLEQSREEDEGRPGGPPVRQSRRIAQMKIREEAERRKLEEMTLQQLKEEQSRRRADARAAKKEAKEGKKRKKKMIESDEDYTAEDIDDESRKKFKKKKKRRKKKASLTFNEKNPWQSSSGSSTSQEDEEEEEEVGRSEEEEEDDELVFKSDHEFSPESDLENDATDVAPTRRARTAQKDQPCEDDQIQPTDEHACQKCGKSDHPEWILLCDKCDSGWHCSCLRPALMVIPEGDWFCPPCEHTFLLKNLHKSLSEFDRNWTRRNNQELRRQRLAYVGISLDNVLPNKDKEDGVESGAESLNEQEARSPPGSENDSESETESSSDDDSEPVYQLRQRRQTLFSYRFSEFDDLINSAIQDEMEAVKGAGNQGRGKDIATIVKAETEELENIKETEDAEEKSEEKMEEKAKEEEEEEEEMLAEEVDKEELPPVVPKHDIKDEDDDEDEFCPFKKFQVKKKHRRLNSLDISSEDDAESDEDFKGTSSDEDEDEFEGSEGESDDSEIGGRRGKGSRRRPSGPVRRSGRARTTRFDKEFINDDSEDSEPPKKKARSVWQDSESEESDASWRRSKRSKKQVPTFKIKKTKSKKKKKKRNKGDLDSDPEVKSKKPKIQYGGLEEEDDVSRSRRTRGRKINYQEFAASDSEEDTWGKSRKIESEDEYVANEEDEEEEDEAPPESEKDSENDTGDVIQNKMHKTKGDKSLQSKRTVKTPKKGKVGKSRKNFIIDSEEEIPPCPGYRIISEETVQNSDDIPSPQICNSQITETEVQSSQPLLQTFSPQRRGGRTRNLGKKQEEQKKKGRRKKSENEFNEFPEGLPGVMENDQGQTGVSGQQFADVQMMPAQTRMAPEVSVKGSEPFSPRRRGTGRSVQVPRKPNPAILSMAVERAPILQSTKGVIEADSLRNLVTASPGVSSAAPPDGDVKIKEDIPPPSGKRRGRGRGKAVIDMPKTPDVGRFPKQQNFPPNSAGGNVVNTSTSSVISRMLQTQPVSGAPQSFTAAATAMGHKYFGNSGEPPLMSMQNTGRGSSTSPYTSPAKTLSSPYRQPPPSDPSNTPGMGTYGSSPQAPGRGAGMRVPSLGFQQTASVRLRSPQTSGQPLVFHTSHHPMDPSPSGGGPVIISSNSGVPPPQSGSPHNSKPGTPSSSQNTPTPPPPPYSRTGSQLPLVPPSNASISPMMPFASQTGDSSQPPVRHPPPFPPSTSANHHQTPQNTSQSSSPSHQGRSPVPGNFSPYHPPPPANYHYGGYPPPPPMSAADDALPPSAFQSSPYTDHYTSSDMAANLQTSDGSNSKSYDEEASGEFGGLVSYFSSQREDDLDT